LRRRLTILSAALFLVFTLVAVHVHQVAADTPGQTGKRIITIHDRGKDIGILTDQTTLRGVFQEAHIELDKNDLVEPSLDDKLVADNYQVNIYRARPVVIVDGASVKKVISAYQTAGQIAAHAGISLRDEDKTSIRPISDIVTYGAGVEVDIDRATPVNLELYGTPTTVYTQATTVGGLLKEKGLTLGKHDQLSVKDDTPIKKDMKFAIWRNGTQTITRRESIAFSVERIEDADRPLGYDKVQTVGKKGQALVTYQATMKNGKIVKKKQIQRVVIHDAKKQVEVVGTKASLPAGSHEDWMSEAGIGSGDYGYINYIFTNESGWNPAARNPAGYVGLGQTSESNLASACSNWQTDPVCQIRFFNGYALGRYGSWENAYDFKRDNGWW